jgi:hypothetical protein
MGESRIGVIINGATGRMGTTQHMANLLDPTAYTGLCADMAREGGRPHAESGGRPRGREVTRRPSPP